MLRIPTSAASAVLWAGVWCAGLSLATAAGAQAPFGGAAPGVIDPGGQAQEQASFPNPDPPVEDLVGVWVVVGDGLWERRLDRDGLRMERVAIGELGLFWAADQLASGRDLFENHLDRLDREAEAERVQLESDIDTLDEAIQAVLDAADELSSPPPLASEEDGEAEDNASQSPFEDCDFAFDVGTTSRGWRPSPWVYPFGIRAEASSTWAAKCGAKATVVSVVETQAAGFGFDPAPFTTFDGCAARGVAAGCSSRSRVAGFSPCRALVRSVVAVPELAFYFEAEEISSRCSSAPNFPDPASPRLWFR